MKHVSISVIMVAAIAASYSAYDSAREYYVQLQNEGGVSAALSDTGHNRGGHAGSKHDTDSHGCGEHHPQHRIVVTSPVEQDVISTQRYVCQVHSRRHIEVCALEGGYLKEIHVQEGQAVKEGDLMFRILPVLYKAKLDSDVAEAQLAQVEYDNTRKLVEQKIVSTQELRLAAAKLAKAAAKVELARAELDFTEIKAPFDGIVDRQLRQQGSLIEEGAVLTTMSDNNVMWVYFNVPEARYLEYRSRIDGDDQEGDENDGHDADDELRIQLLLANGHTFPQPGRIGAIEADFNNETGNIAFRADFPNPGGLLRHGQTGTILIHRELDDAIVIPQRATFEVLARQYVFVVDKDNVVHQRDITVQQELEDIFVISKGLSEDDRIVYEGVRQVRDGDKVQYEYRSPDEILSNLKFHAE